MSAYLRQWITPPVIAGDEEQLVARLLHYILLLTFAANLLYTVAVAVLGLSSDLLWVDAVAAVGIGVLMVMLRQQYIRSVGWIFSLLLLMMVVAAGFDDNVGLTDLHYGISAVLVLVVASVVLGRSGAAIFTGLVIGCSVLLYLVVPPPAGFTANRILLTLILDCVIFATVGFFTGHSVFSLSKALTRAQTSEQALVKNNAQLMSEIAARESVERTLRTSEEQERQLQQRLRALNGVSNDLSKIASPEALCSKSVELAHERLGFDGVGLYLVDEGMTTITSAFVTDKDGKSQQQHDPQPIPAELLTHLKHDPDQPAAAVQVYADVALQGEAGHVGGRGWRLISTLYGDKGVVGWISVDNGFQHKPINPHDSEILQLYRITIEHLYGQRRAEHALVEMAVKKERVELINELVSNLSHDLRTPLSIINNSLYLLQKLEEPERQREKAKVIEMQSRRLERLINDVLMMSKLEQQDVITMRPIKLNDLVAPIKQGFESTAETRKQRLITTLEAALPPMLGSHDGLERIISNLLENAINYTPDEGTVTIRTYKSALHVVLEVSDTGIGINEDDQKRIFDRFYRADPARSLQSGGTGLGLAICKRLVDMHKGKIEVESTVGKGSIFRVSFLATYAPQVTQEVQVI